jgi:hypothetical protein
MPMQQVVIKVEEGKYALLLQLLRSLDYVKVEIPPARRTKTGSKPKYDFSDLAGKLQWRGDAVAEQRRMRDEW